jgi:lysophospholipase L1-like esterase
MNSRYLALALLSATLIHASAQNAAPPAPAPKPVVQMPDVAAPKMGTNGLVNASFQKSHESFVAIAKKGDVGLLFLGDSITAGWNGQKALWTNAFGKYKPANFGIGGDRTQHVLWRIENGELEGIKPKAAVLMIGTNNSGGDSAENIAKGIIKIVETIRAKLPETKILLLAVFPRGEKPNPQRTKLIEVNKTIAKLDDGKHIFYLDIGNKFLEPDGTMSKEIMKDFLHPTAKGYQIWADAIADKVAELSK